MSSVNDKVGLVPSVKGGAIRCQYYMTIHVLRPDPDSSSPNYVEVRIFLRRYCGSVARIFSRLSRMVAF
jgi:hypothetical protein